MNYDELKKIVEQYGFMIEDCNYTEVYIYAPYCNYYHNDGADSDINRVCAVAIVNEDKNIESLHLYQKIRKVRYGGIYFDGCSEKVVYSISESFIENLCKYISKKIKKIQSKIKMNQIKDMF
jgi:hypothetical protein